MTDYEKYVAFTTQLKTILDKRMAIPKKIKPITDENTIRQFGSQGLECVPRKLCKARIRRLRLEINDVIREIENKCETAYLKQDEKEDWYK